MINSETGESLSGVQVKLNNGHSSSGSTAHTATTNEDGNAIFSGVTYGPYTAVVEESGFNAGQVEIDLNSDSVSHKLAVNPTNSDYDMVLELDTDDAEADFDLKVYAQNPEGHECEISPVNKYCAYGQHYKDNQLGENG